MLLLHLNRQKHFSMTAQPRSGHPLPLQHVDYLASPQGVTGYISIPSRLLGKAPLGYLTTIWLKSVLHSMTVIGFGHALYARSPE